MLLAGALFDMDGVLTRTAAMHAAAWKELFDDFLRRRAAPGGRAWRPFDADADYRAYVDGKPRREGVRSFIASRHIELPEGEGDAAPEADTVVGLGQRKDALFEARLRREGVQTFATTLALVRALRAHGVKTAVVTSSRHGRGILAAAGIDALFDARIDGLDIEARALRGKPDPDAFLAAAAALGVPAERCAVFEDASAGVEAGRRGGFGLVVGVDRGGNRRALAEHGADLVVDDLAALGVEQLEARLRAAARAPVRSGVAWRVEQEGFDRAREHAMESLFAVGNGYLGVRGALDSPLAGSQGDLFIAGIYDRKRPELPYSEPEFLDRGRGDYAYSEIVPLPFPFGVRISAAGQNLDLAGTRWRAQRRVLDLAQGVLHTEAEFDGGDGGRVRLRARRCASLADPHLLVQEVVVEADAEITLDTSLIVPGLLDRHPHLVPLDVGEETATIERLCFRTRASGYEICIAARTTLVGSGRDGTRWTVAAQAGTPLALRRYVVVFSSRDVADPHAAAAARVRELRWDDFDAAFATHAARWDELWDQADIRVAGAAAAEQALRFNSYHLLIAAGTDPRVSVGARSLTGRAYEGHVFWDVEIFMLPFYLHVAPERARSLMLYRFHTLAGARRRACELGFRGACYAWESTVTGDDATPRAIWLKTTGKEIPIFTGTQQVHVTADVAYGLCRYWEATGDAALMRDAGAEILVETARFWASRVTAEGARYHIRGVVGPDEYHHSVNDNAYTNWMARHNLQQAARACAWLAREHRAQWGALAERCALGRNEPDEWRETASGLFCPGPDARGVIEQFEGFFDLGDYALADDERFRPPVSRLFEWDRINRLKVIKQADVLMLMHLFPDAFPREVVAANYRYYEPLTDHGSSLSPAIHAAIAARLGLREDAERYWRQSLWLDLSNKMGNSVLGVHPAAMGGAWQALVFGFLDVRLDEDGAHAGDGAYLLEGCDAVTFSLAYRGQRHALNVARREPAR
ncbi:MAG: beta-phosphoglucomutase family hydrolase [Rubrivivax sp.]|nr:beta-phosphoglucomutase family hydrolase [Rubrivivax sp.]